MRKFALSLVALGFSTSLVMAQTPTTFADVDADSGGELSLGELQAAWPDLTQGEFDAADADASGELSVAELNALQAQTGDSTVPAPTEPATP